MEALGQRVFHPAAHRAANVRPLQHLSALRGPNLQRLGLQGVTRGIGQQGAGQPGPQFLVGLLLPGIPEGGSVQRDVVGRAGEHVRGSQRGACHVRAELRHEQQRMAQGRPGHAPPASLRLAGHPLDVQVEFQQLFVGQVLIRAFGQQLAVRVRDPNQLHGVHDLGPVGHPVAASAALERLPEPPEPGLRLGALQFQQLLAVLVLGQRLLQPASDPPVVHSLFRVALLQRLVELAETPHFGEIGAGFFQAKREFVIGEPLCQLGVALPHERQHFVRRIKIRLCALFYHLGESRIAFYEGAVQ